MQQDVVVNAALSTLENKEPKYQDSSELAFCEGNVASLKSDNKEMRAEEVGKRSSSSGFEVLCYCIK